MSGTYRSRLDAIDGSADDPARITFDVQAPELTQQHSLTGMGNEAPNMGRVSRRQPPAFAIRSTP